MADADDAVDSRLQTVRLMMLAFRHHRRPQVGRLTLMMLAFRQEDAGLQARGGTSQVAGGS